MSETGRLFVVATPIGNLADLSPRAREVLTSADQILAEDTRHSAGLLRHHGITTPLRSLHEHNERERSAELIRRLERGESLALVSDAGTPLISDPGYRLVRAAHDAGIPIRAVPGPSALTAALSIAGQPTDRFVFEGYLPPKPAARRRRLAALAPEPRTLVFYETPHRLAAALEDLVDCFGAGRPATLVKELTKQHEQALRATLSELRQWLGTGTKRGQGEFVLVVAGNPEPAAGDDPRPLLRALRRHLPVKAAAAAATEISGRPRNELYRLLLELDGGEETDS